MIEKISSFLLICVFILCAGTAGFVTGYDKRNADLQIAVDLIAKQDAELEHLRSTLDSARNRALSVGNGLDEAANIALAIADRNKRVAAIVDAIRKCVIELKNLNSELAR